MLAVVLKIKTTYRRYFIIKRTVAYPGGDPGDESSPLGFFDLCVAKTAQEPLHIFARKAISGYYLGVNFKNFRATRDGEHHENILRRERARKGLNFRCFSCVRPVAGFARKYSPSFT